MKIEMNETDKLAMFWLTNAEQDDALLQAQIQHEVSAYQQQKYTVAVFHSGKSDLQNATEGLLLHNQKVLARRDIECEQKANETQQQFLSM